jgi:hypothetical protein
MADTKAAEGIRTISLKGFKSFAEPRVIEIRPLTVLAGANSSGKSSALQPLLLLKQTLEHSFDPGPLLLDGPHVRFSSADELLSLDSTRISADELEVGMMIESGLDTGLTLSWNFRRAVDDKLQIGRMDYGSGHRPRDISLTPDMTSEEIAQLRLFKGARKSFPEAVFKVIRNRCFLGVVMEGAESAPPLPRTSGFDRILRSIIHVPGLRGNPKRTYEAAEVGRTFAGTFEHYAASVIAGWQRAGDPRLEQLGEQLDDLGLTSKIAAQQFSATQVSLLVERLPGRRGSGVADLVNMADVGFGVSQVLPVLVALLAAEPGRLVYIEQPELHLHPRAQQALAAVLAETAERGVQVVVETHSSTLLLALQALIAAGRLSPGLVKLHWFWRDASGVTQVESADVDKFGAYGDWPEDFGEVQAGVEGRYLDAVEAAAFGKGKNGRRKTDRR